MRKAEKIISKDLFSTSKFNLAASANQKVPCKRRKYILKVRDPAAKEIAKWGWYIKYSKIDINTETSKCRLIILFEFAFKSVNHLIT